MEILLNQHRILTKLKWIALQKFNGLDSVHFLVLTFLCLSKLESDVISFYDGNLIDST